MHRRIVAPAVLLILAACALSACASTPEPTSLTLGKSKPLVQLLRNEAAGRVPLDVVQQSANEDYSEACGDDPSVRSWHSAVRLEVDEADAEAIDAIIEELSASFEKDGWIATPGNEREELKQAVYIKSGNDSEIHITSEVRAGVGRSVLVTVFGPCVQTDGPDSDEVTSLEGDD